LEFALSSLAAASDE
jgi:hypothetical protein